MIRALFLVFKIGLLIAALLWVASVAAGGSVDIAWHGYLVETTPGVLLAGVLVLAALLAALSGLWQFLVSLPRRWRRQRAQVARDDGYRALTQGLVAVAAGDAKRAEKMMQRAQTALPEQPLTRLLTAQTALLLGNDAAAKRAFADLLDDPEGAFFGVRGLLNEALARRDYSEALAYLRRADQLQPKRPWILRGLFDLEVKSRHWQAAEKTLRRLQRAGALDAPSIRQSKQVVWLAESLEYAANDSLPAATRQAEQLRFAQAAYRLNVDFIPASLILADALMTAGKSNAARKLIRRAWERGPHPQLLTRWLQLRPATRGKNIFGKSAPTLSEAEATFAWIEELTALRPDHIDSQQALGRAAMATSKWVQARPLLTAANDYRALAELEQRQSGDEAAALVWLEKAADQPPAHAWICDACAHSESAWLPLCPQCDSFNAFQWRRPDLQQGHMLALRQRMGAPLPFGIASLTPVL